MLVSQTRLGMGITSVRRCKLKPCSHYAAGIWKRKSESEEFKNATIPGHSGYLFQEDHQENHMTKSHVYRGNSALAKLRFWNVFSPRESKEPVFSSCCTLKRFFENLHFRDGLEVWKVGETSDFKLRFKIRDSVDAAYKVVFSPLISFRLCLTYELPDSNEVCLPFCLNLKLLAKDTR